MSRSGSRSRPCHGLVVGAIAATVMAASPAAARAQSIHIPDAVGDVVSVAVEGPVAAPERTLSDVRKTTLTHGARRLKIRVDYVELQKVGHHELDIEMVTNERVRRTMELTASPGRWSGDTWMWSGGKQSKQVCMDALRHSVDYEANVMKFSFPRRCASNPRWVTFRIGAIVDDSDGVYVDDALRSRALTAQDRNLAWSTRVRR